MLNQLLAADITTSPAMAMPTKHWDSIYVSRYYNWKPGSWKNGYTEVSVYHLKAAAPDDAIDMLSKHLVVPLLEKLLADGTILEYEIDTAAIHTGAPGMFAIIIISPQPEGLDTVSAAIRGSQKDHPPGIEAFGYMEDYSTHRDELLKGDGIYK